MGFSQAASRSTAFLAGLPFVNGIKFLHILKGGHRRPPLVVTFFGPTGAGKSTLFREVTGVEVPIDVRRPCTYACVVAAPESYRLAMRQIFPGFNTVPLESPSQLREKNPDPKLLYSVPFSRSKSIPLVVADVPDFNGIDQAFNRPRAEAMLQRAEVVIFVATVQQYANDDVVRELAMCCRLAGRLAFVLNLVPTRRNDPKEISREIWDDFLEKLRKRSEFAEVRSDGRTLRDFLSTSSVYFVPYIHESRNPGLNDIQRVTAESTPISSLLFGDDAENTLMRGYMEPAHQTIAACRVLLEQLAGRRLEREDALREAERHLHAAAHRIAEGKFPISRVMALVNETVEQGQHFLTRMIGRPFLWLGRGVSALQLKLASFYDFLKWAPRDDIKPRDEMEKESLMNEARRLTGEWRSDFPEERRAGGILSAEQCDSCCLALSDPKSFPQPAKEWEEQVRHELAIWVASNGWYCNLMAASTSLLCAAGVTLVAADLVISGGFLSTTVGPIALAGGSTIAVGRLFDWAKDWRLQSVVDVAAKAWQSQREQEFFACLDERLYRSLFRKWIDELAALKQAPVDSCRMACDRLDELALNLRERS